MEAFFGTHNSVTGEKSFGFFNIFKWFSKTQKYTIKEQAKKGVKFFDLRVKRTNRGWVCAHGLWETEKTFSELLREISKNTIHDIVYISVTYEGTLPKDLSEISFLKFIRKSLKKYTNLILYSVFEKYKKTGEGKRENYLIWEKGGLEIIKYYTQFSNLKPFPPIPVFWKKTKLENISDDEKTIIIVDFYDK